MTAATDRIVDHGLGAQFTDLPPNTVAATKTFLLDSLGVGIAGASTPLTQKVRKAAIGWGAGTNAHTWGKDSARLPAPSAAFVNGFQIHCQEYDCVHEPAVVHPMAVILSAIMAEVEHTPQKISGTDLAIALVVAVDLAAGLGVATSSPIKFFRPANAGLFGASLAIARLRGFNQAQTKETLGYALAFCSGTMQAHVEGKPALPLQIANASRSAHMAADIVAEGIPGAIDAIEGPFGYLKLFEDETDISPVADSLGKIWHIADVSHKPFPTGRAAQGGIVLMQSLREQGVTPDNVQHIRLTAPPIIPRLVGRPLIDNLTANHARLCFQYSGARALMTGGVGLDDFSDAAMADAATRNLGARITVVSDGSDNPAAFVPQTAVAELTDGREVTARIDTLFGSPANPMSDADHLTKFRSCVEFGFGSPSTNIADSLIDAVNSLESLDDSARLSRLAAGQEV